RPARGRWWKWRMSWSSGLTRPLWIGPSPPLCVVPVRPLEQAPLPDRRLRARYLPGRLLLAGIGSSDGRPDVAIVERHCHPHPWLCLLDAAERVLAVADEGEAAREHTAIGVALQQAPLLLDAAGTIAEQARDP